MRTLDYIGAIPSASTIYTDQPTVLAVQKALKLKGFDPGALDGIFGKKTLAAVKQLQAKLKSDQTGAIDYGVLMALGVSAPGAKAAGPGTAGGGVTGGGAAASTPSAPGSSAMPAFLMQDVPYVNRPLWQVLVGGLGLGAIGVGVYRMVRK